MVTSSHERSRILEHINVYPNKALSTVAGRVFFTSLLGAIFLGCL